MNEPKQNRRKSGVKKLEPIDWREFANDAVLQGNMSSLYHRPAGEDAAVYASPEALLEIERRKPSVGIEPAVSIHETEGLNKTAGLTHTPVTGSTDVPASGGSPIIPTVDFVPTVGIYSTEVLIPSVGLAVKSKVKPISEVQDALTLAGQVLYRAMYGAAEGTELRTCTKGYRELARETRLDKDTVRDLISEFKEKGILREIAKYDPDTRLAKTYEVLSSQAMVRMWREAGIRFVTTGRHRPAFCTAEGAPLTFKPTVGREPC